MLYGIQRTRLLFTYANSIASFDSQHHLSRRMIAGSTPWANTAEMPSLPTSSLLCERNHITHWPPCQHLGTGPCRRRSLG
jgi:hypothetical protein